MNDSRGRTASSLVFTGGLFVFIGKFITVTTPQDNVIEKLELVLERQRKEIFDLKEENQMLKIQLKAMGVDTQE
jgi:hypothetical protein